MNTCRSPQHVTCQQASISPNHNKKPWDADSFIYPLVRELLELASGVSTYDALSSSLFTLHAYVITAFGDIPAISMLMHMKGHNSLCPCRMCEIKGIHMPDS